MESYVLKVVSGEDPERDADPAESEEVIAAVERLYAEIRRCIVKAELRLQGDVPDSLLAHAGIMDDCALSRDARRFTDETLDYLGGGSRGSWLGDTFEDVVCRKRIAGAALDIASLLDGDVLVHGYGDDATSFSGVDTIWVTGLANAVVRAHPGGLVGVVVKDPMRKGHWAVSNGRDLTPMVLVSGQLSRYDAEDFAGAGPVIATGTVIRDEENRIVELRAVENCYTFPGAVFLRALADGRDLGLVQPLVGNPGHYARTGRWTMTNRELGIESSAEDWDSCVMGFHRMFVELWEAHRDGTAEENPRLRAMLDSICPFAGIPEDEAPE